jgi:intracellular sulfur oxidation DsrE/DsrF family protein
MHRSVALLVAVAAAHAPDRTYLEVSPGSKTELVSLLDTLEASLSNGLPAGDPVVIILHGSEALPFTRAGYASNRALVDRAALLDAYRLIDVRMCETWMNRNNVRAEEIPAFIETVPYAPEEIERLEADGFVPWESVDI